MTARAAADCAGRPSMRWRNRSKQYVRWSGARSVVKRLPLASSEGGANTPASKKVEVFAPFGWDLHDTDYQPAVTSLQSEGYQVVTPHVQSTLNDTSQAVTIPQFLASGGDGVVIVDGHGSQSWLPLETYTKTPAGRTSALDALARYGAQYGQANVAWTDQGAKSYQVGLTLAGIANLWHGNQTLVVLLVCNGTNLALNFIRGGAQVVFYYSGLSYTVKHGVDAQCFFSHLDGSAYPDGGLDDPRLRTTDRAFADCKGKIESVAAITGKRPLTLAPAVQSRAPDPKTSISVNGAPFSVDVAFDTTMNQHMDASSVVTLQGCGTGGKNKDEPEVVKPLNWTAIPYQETSKPPRAVR